MVIILGGSGYVGTAFQYHLTEKKVDFKNVSRSTVDYSRPEVLRDFLKQTRPEFVLNCAGYTGKPNVDACELHKTECLNGNAVLPGILKEVCESLDIPWGHVSSGCIYSGTRPDGRGFTETDAPNFSFRQNHCSFYSGTKALGEEILADAQKCFVWRLRIPFNNVNNPRNYLSKVLNYQRLLEACNSLSQLQEFARACWETWTRKVPFGIYNVTNPGSITTHEVVELIRKNKVSTKEFHFFASEEEFMKVAAKTPRSNCVLDTTKLQQTGIRMTEVHDAVDQALKNWKS